MIGAVWTKKELNIIALTPMTTLHKENSKLHLKGLVCVWFSFVPRKTVRRRLRVSGACNPVPFKGNEVFVQSDVVFLGGLFGRTT